MTKRHEKLSRCDKMKEISINIAYPLKTPKSLVFIRKIGSIGSSI